MRRVTQDVAAHPDHVPVDFARNCGVTLGVVADLRAVAPTRQARGARGRARPRRRGAGAARPVGPELAERPQRLDALDPSVVPARSYPVPGGLTAREVRATVSAAVAQMPRASATVASWDPAYDIEHRMPGTGLELVELPARLAG